MSRKVKKRYTSEVEFNDIQSYQSSKRRSVVLSPRNKNQREYINKLQNEDKSIIFAIGPAGTGKAQPLDAKIKIPGGWTTMGDIKKGDIVSTPSGDTATVIELFPQGKKDTFFIEFEDGRVAECCGEHLWEVYIPSFDLTKIMSTFDIIDDQDNVLYIKLPEHEKMDDIDLPLDPYILGVLLNSGDLLSYPTIDIVINNQSVLENINKQTDVIKKSDNVYTLTNKSISESVNSMGLFGKSVDKKFIPEIYLHSSKNQKLSLLHGLFDYNAFVSANDLIFSTYSKQVCDSIIYLIRSIGGIAEYTVEPSNLACNDTNDLYEIYIRYNNINDLLSFRNEPSIIDLQLISIKSIVPSGNKECQCILIDSDDHLYITNDFIVTHNTMLAVQYGIKLLQEGKIEKIVVTRPAVSVDEDIGFLPGTLTEKMAPWMVPIFDVFEEYYQKKDITRYLEDGVIEISPLAFMRGRTMKNAYIIADESQGCTPSQMKMLLTRIGDNSKMVVTGDLDQADRGNNNGLREFINLYYEHQKSNQPSNIDFIEFHTKDIERHPAVGEVLSIYNKGEKGS